MSNIDIVPSNIEGCFIIKTKIFNDNRGKFSKIFNEDLFKQNNLNHFYEEVYYSISHKGVLRGLHFQTPPNAHIKLVSCLSGNILDVVCDLRKNSKTFKKVFSAELNSNSGDLLYVPEGLAHGFYTLSEKAIFLSMNSKKYSPLDDSGIRWNSIPFDWSIIDPKVSDKDKYLVELDNFKTPFI